jgi:signal transduction histidine kinase
MEEPVKFYTDKFRLNIILKNLIANAFRYSDFEKEDPTIEISIKSSISHCMILIRDNGLGIAEEHQDNVFGMFYRANTISKGSGLGLYLVKECMHKIAGEVYLRSELGEFTEFTLNIENMIDEEKNAGKHTKFYLSI